METDTSDAAAVDRLMEILPEDTLNVGQEEPAGAAKPEAKAEAPAAEKEEVKAQDTNAQSTVADEDVEIEIKGERYKVPPALRDSIMMHADYTKKTMDLAEERKALEALKANASPEIEPLRQKLTHYEALLGQQLVTDQKTDWMKLLREDPIGYLEQKELADKRAVEWQQLTAKKNEEYQQKFSQTLAHEAQQLVAKRPEWKDVAVWNADFEKMKPSLRSAGFSEQEINNAVDHRMILIADKARKWDELQTSKTEVAKKIEKLPPKVERPGVGGNEGQANQAAMQRLRKTGDVDDAAAALRALMN